jgi:hypothetical protein
MLNVTVDPSEFQWMMPGERRIAIWGTNRVRMVQSNSKDLVAGAYVVLAALWGSIGGVVVLLGVILDAVSRNGISGSALLLAGIASLAVAALRVVQSRKARHTGDP